MQIPFIGTAILLVIYQLFFFHTGFGLGWLAFLIPAHLYILLTHRKNGNGVLSVISSILALLLYGLSAWSGNWITQSVSLLTAIGLSFFTVFTSKLKTPFSWTFLHTIFAPLLVLLYGCGNTLFRLFHRESKEKSTKKDTHLFSHIRGFLFALPVIIILFTLFQSADPLYNKFIHTLFDTIGDRLFTTGIIGVFFLFIGSIALTAPPTLPEQHKQIKEGIYEELRMFLGLIAFVIGTFVVVQIRYLFLRVGETELSSILGVAGYTYSQYVTKGFFELIIASGIAGIVLLYGAYQYSHVIPQKKRPLQFLAFGIGIEVMVLIASALQRLQLYVGNHGLTLARGYGALLLVSITIAIILCVLQYIVTLKKIPRYILWSLPVLVFLFGLHVIPLDRLIATRFPPTVNGVIDYYYISLLSQEAYPSWTQAMTETRRISKNLSEKKEWSGQERADLFWTEKTLGNLCASMTEVTVLFGTIDEIRTIRSACLPHEPISLSKVNETGKLSDLPSYFYQRRGWQSFTYANYQAYRYLWSHKEIIQMAQESNVYIGSITAHFSKNWETAIPHDRRIEPLFLK